MLTGATPVGGEYDGPGVTGGMFIPGDAGVGVHTLTYTYVDENGCEATCEFIVTVNPVPEVQCPPDMIVCIDAAAMELTGGLPEGGTYSGDGVVGGMFNPAAAGALYHAITYTYTSEADCVNSCVFGITVVDCDDGDPCTLDVCDPATSECSHVAVNCDDEDPCTEDRCVPETGACAHVQICEGEGEPVEGEGEAIQPSLDITKTADKTSYSTVGEVITYTIVVTNTGNCVLTDVNVVDALTGLDTVIASLAIGASETFTETYVVTEADLEAGRVLNSVTASARDPEGDILEDSAERDVPADEVSCCEDFDIWDPGNLFLGALALLVLFIASLYLGGGELPVKF